MGKGRRISSTQHQSALRLSTLRFSTVAAVVAVSAFTSGCSDSLPSLPKISDLNPFAEKQIPLAGKRVAQWVLAAADDGHKSRGEHHDHA